MNIRIDRKNRSRRNKRVLVAMSGGVDSSVAAALLKRDGFIVSGAFMKCWNPNYFAEKTRGKECASAEDATMARLAAESLGIPFYVFDFTKEYKKSVFEYFISEYRSGGTPNPDVMCNKRIKFGLFLEKARRLGFDYIATGHYVRLRREFPTSNFQVSNKSQIKNSKSKTIKLLRAKDTNKDQSYFLWTLTQEQLRHSLFPIGEYTKPQVRELARKFGLPNAERKDSQGICFVGKVSLMEFLREYIPSLSGRIVDRKGNVLGRHAGVFYYTIGQRQGLGLSGGPWWVIRKDVHKNLLEVTRNKKDLYGNIAVVQDVNWISGESPQLPFRAEAAIRYRQKPEPALIKKIPNTKQYLLEFVRPQLAIAKGQSAVVWKRENLLGGGIIVGTFSGGQ